MSHCSGCRAELEQFDQVRLGSTVMRVHVQDRLDDDDLVDDDGSGSDDCVQLATSSSVASNNGGGSKRKLKQRAKELQQSRSAARSSKHNSASSSTIDVKEQDEEKENDAAAAASSSHSDDDDDDDDQDGDDDNADTKKKQASDLPKRKTKKELKKEERTLRKQQVKEAKMAQKISDAEERVQAKRDEAERNRRLAQQRAAAASTPSLVSVPSAGSLLPFVDRVNDHCIRISKGFVPRMHSEGIVFANELLTDLLLQEHQDAKSSRGGFISSLKQVANVASLTGIVGPSLAMPDIHSGYGFAIGNVVAIDMNAPGAVVSPGGVGFDINCGVRLIRTNLMRDNIKDRKMKALADTLYANIPVGVGTHSTYKLNAKQLDCVLNDGMKFLLSENLCWEEDVLHVEEGGCMKGADANMVSVRAKQRGLSQNGTLGSGNHYIEVQCVDEIYGEEEAKAMGLVKGQIVVMIHSGSRGLGHEVCSNYVQQISQQNNKSSVELNDKQLTPIEINSTIGRNYLAAMNAAANYAFVNRSLMTKLVRDSFESVFGLTSRELDMHVVYDVSHNIAKVEEHTWEGKTIQCLVHRKGATRAFPPYHPLIPRDYQHIGQPVLIGGSMGTCSYVLTGAPGSMLRSFGSTCHGAGRALSRSAAMKEINSDRVLDSLHKQGIEVRIAHEQSIAEEAPQSYKDVSEVVDTCAKAGISKTVARLLPVAVIKG